MSVRLRSRQVLWSARLFVLLALTARIGGSMATIDSKADIENTPTLHHIHQVGTQTHRYLRAHLQPALDEVEDDSEERERGLDGISTLIYKLTPDKQKAAEKLFTRLKLDTVTSNVFQSPKFEKWVTSVASSYKKAPADADAAIFSALSSKIGDEALAGMLLAAKEVSGTKALATRLEKLQLQKWKSDGKSVDDAFALLQLKHDVSVMKSPALNTWVSYVETLSENPYGLLYSRLKTRYGDEALARLIVQEKQSSLTRSVAENLEKAQIMAWVDRKLSKEQVFNLLKLQNDGEKLLTNPLFTTWASYMTKTNPQRPYNAMFRFLQQRYGTQVLSNMIFTAIGGSRPSPTASRLEQVLVKVWADSGQSADDIFMGLRLHSKSKKLLENPTFTGWASYVATTEKKNAGARIVSVLLKNYDDDVVARMLAAARKAPSTKALAANLQQELWLSQRKSAADVFKLLKLDKEGSKVFESAELGTWLSFATAMNTRKKAPDEFAAISVLEKQFSSELELASALVGAKIDAGMKNAINKKEIAELQQLQFKQWLGKDLNPTMLELRLIQGGFDKRNLGVFLGYRDFYKSSQA